MKSFYIASFRLKLSFLHNFNWRMKLISVVMKESTLKFINKDNFYAVIKHVVKFRLLTLQYKLMLMNDFLLMHAFSLGKRLISYQNLRAIWVKLTFASKLLSSRALEIHKISYFDLSNSFSVFIKVLSLSILIYGIWFMPFNVID